MADNAPTTTTTQQVINLLTETIKPEVKSKWEALFIFLHAVLQLNGFKLVGLGEQDNLVQDKQLPTEWNSPDSFAFRYRHSQSSMVFLVKGIRMGNLLLVHALAVEQNQILNLELNTTEFIANETFQNLSNLYKNGDKLIQEISQKIVLNLVPTVEHLRAASREQSQQPQRQPPQPQPNHPDFPDDPLRVGPPRYPRPGFYPPAPGGIGGDDLDPFSGVGGMGVFPTPYPIGGRRGGGGLVGPGHPMFGPGVLDPYARGGGGFGGPGRGTYPPPGARFDPFGPPGFRSGPDNDHERPPRNSGYDDDMFS